MNKKEKAVVNLAKFIESQSLVLLDKLNELDIDALAEEVEAFSDHAERVKQRINEWFETQSKPLSPQIITLNENKKEDI